VQKALLNTIHIYCSNLIKKIYFLENENLVFAWQGDYERNEKGVKTEQYY
jgi:hypothetical protein